MSTPEYREEEFPLKSLFLPLTNFKAINWIVIIGIIVFANMLFNGFVWDDVTYIILNPEIHTLNLLNLFGPNVFNSIGQYRPIPAIYFALLYNLFGNTQFFYHLFQLVLHITNTILLFYLFNKFFKLNIAFVLSLIFLVHPIQVESVSFISAAISPLFFVFGISALLLTLHEKIHIKSLIIICGLLLLSLLTKETGLLFLFVILLFQFIFKKKYFNILLIGGVVTFTLYLMIRFWIGGVYLHKLLLIPISRLTFTERMLNVPEIIFYYLKTIFFPIQLIHNQLWIIQNITPQKFYIPLIIDILFFMLLIGIGYFIYHAKKENFKVFLYFSVWFIAGLFLHLQIFPLDQTVADRWFYFPLVGLLGLIGVVLASIKYENIKYKKLFYSLLIVIILALSIRTIVRNTNWTDAITLYTHDSKIENNFDIETNLAAEYLIQNNYNEAVIHFKRSIDMQPHKGNIYNLGVVYEKMGNVQAAEEQYKKALKAVNYYK